jgi:hypothetical protein
MSELIRRVETTDPDDLMPPPESGDRLSSADIQILRQWIDEGAVYDRHWSYTPPTRPQLPEVVAKDWVQRPLDAFIIARLEQENLAPSPQADRSALIRRASLDLTGLPPDLSDLEAYLNDTQPGAHERMIDRLLQAEAFGEHWAHYWLDQARYADSAGYADDPGRTIWAYRDYVVRSFNANKPFDQFTIEQLAGDLLPNATEEQIVATAFHRNTMTNNEGGTSDEEFRNVAVADRVNTTMEVWMGTTMACAQCHDHKYDPISQEDYFRMFAILNNTADADRTDESPLLLLFSEEQQRERERLSSEIRRLLDVLKTTTPALAESQSAWESQFQDDVEWSPVHVSPVSSTGSEIEVLPDHSVRFGRGRPTDIYTLRTDSVSLPNAPVTAFKLEVMPDERPPGRGVGHAGGAFVLSQVRVETHPLDGTVPRGRYLRIELPGENKILSLAEVEIWSGEPNQNIAIQGVARQSSTSHGGEARRAIDGNTDGNYAGAQSTTHTETSRDPWWEIDLTEVHAIDRVTLWNRTDGAQERLKDFDVILLDAEREVVWRQRVGTVPKPQLALTGLGLKTIPLTTATASYSQPGFEADKVIRSGQKQPEKQGWAVGPHLGQSHELRLVPGTPVHVSADDHLVVHLEHTSEFDYATLARVRLSVTSQERAPEQIRLSPPLIAAVRTPFDKRSAEQAETLRTHFLSITPDLQSDRDQLAVVRQQFEAIRPYTTVPVFKELAGDQRRKTHIHRRGNFLDPGQEVVEGLPDSLHTWNEETPVDRLTLARWLVDPKNPLTARVQVNRLWAVLFGVGLVSTSEEFGAQGDLPSHPDLLDWLAVELIESGWDLKHMLRLITTSATYQQSSAVSTELAAMDPDNRLLARGPRFRLSAETIRDQAMHLSGLLSRTLYGPPVKPPQPRMGLSAAFGSGTDWETSPGEDRYRRGLYTTWRRSNPYPSMATFDAPNREVCVVQRDRSNTPLQALVTLNDPVYVEAAQALARRMMQGGATPVERIRQGFMICLSRAPQDAELVSVLNLYSRALETYSNRLEEAKLLSGASEISPENKAVELAAWTLVGNVLLNLDEVLMKR